MSQILLLEEDQKEELNCCICLLYTSPAGFSENRLREYGSLPATFYVLTRVIFLTNDNSRKVKHNQLNTRFGLL